MEAKKLKIADVARDTGVHRNTLTALYNDTAQRVELDVIDTLCEYLHCTVCKLFEWVEG